MKPSPKPLSATDAATHALSELRAGYVARYGHVVFDLAARAEVAGVCLQGEVLLASQRDAAIDAVRAVVTASVTESIDVLADSGGTDGWWIGHDGLLDVLGRPGGELATQWQADDPPLRRLAVDGGDAAVLLADGTIGWVTAGQLESAPGDMCPADVAAWRAEWRGAAHSASEADWRAALAPWWGVPYRWGGATPSGVDCSGLTQRLYHAVVGLGLPKHSADQLRCGERVAQADLTTGDLVGLKHVERRLGHVAVVLGAAPTTLAHASLERGVVEEPMSDVLSRYQFRSARRFRTEGSA